MKSQRHAGVGSRQHAAVPFPPDGGGAGGVLAITWTSGRPTGFASANTGSHAVSAAKLTALSKPRAIIRGRNTVARPPLPTSARILNPEKSRTITGSTFEHPSRPVSLSPPIRTKKATGVTTETHKPSLPLTKNGGSIRPGGLTGALV